MARVSLSTRAPNSFEVIVKNSTTVYLLVLYTYSNSTLYMSRLEGGSSYVEFASHTVLTGNTANRMSAAIDSSGIIHINYVTVSLGDNDTKSYYITFDTSTNTFAASATQLDSGGRSSSAYEGSDVDIDSNGKVHIVYTKGVSSMGAAYAQVYYINNVSGSWSTPELVSAGGTADCRDVCMSVCASNNIEVMWRVYSAGTVYWRRRTTSWGTATAYSTGASGNTLIAKTDDTIYRYHIHYTTNYYIYENNADANTTTAYVSQAEDTISAALVGQSKRVVLYIEPTTNANYLAKLENNGSGWSHSDITSDTSTLYVHTSWHYNCNNNPANTLWFAYYMQGPNIYVDFLTWGTSTKGSSPAYTHGGDVAKSNAPGFTAGDYARSKAPAYAEGYQGGRSSLPAHAHGKDNTKTNQANYLKGCINVESALPAFMKGRNDIRFDVVPFTTKTSSGTQDITGSLNGFTPQLAILFGALATGSTGTDESLYTQWFGWANGTNQQLATVAVPDGLNGTLGAAIYTDRCAGGQYNTGGNAAFSSWIANGIRLNYTVGAGSAYRSIALLIAGASAEMVKSKIGTFTLSNVWDGSSQAITGLGFKPDLVLFMHLPVGTGSEAIAISMAVNSLIANSLDQRLQASQYNSGYFNWAYGRSIDGYVMYNAINSGAYRCHVASIDSDGFTMESDLGDGTYSLTMYYLAIKLVEPYQIFCDYTNPNALSVYTGHKTLAALCFHNDYGGAPDGLGGPFGIGAVKPGITQQGGAGHTGFSGASWIGKSLWHTGRVLYERVADGTVNADYTVTAIGNGGLTLSGTGSVFGLWLSFGEGTQLRSSQPAYIFAHRRATFAYLHGAVDTASSCHAFFHVVDAQDHTPAYTEGLNPARSSKPAFTRGYNAGYMVAAAEFTCATSAGSQDITTPDLCGLTPKLALIFLQGSRTGEAIEETNFINLVAATDGTNCISIAQRAATDPDHPYPNENIQHYGSNLLTIPDDYAAAIDGQAAFTSFIANGIRLNWSNPPNYAERGVIVFFAGTDIAHAVIGKQQFPSKSGSDAYSYWSYATIAVNLGWRPTFILGLQPTGKGGGDHEGFDLDINPAAPIPQDMGIDLGLAVDPGDASIPGQTFHRAMHYGESDYWTYLEIWQSGSIYAMAKDGYLTGDMRIYSFDANGFTWQPGLQSGAAALPDWCYIAVQLDSAGRRKAAVAYRTYHLDPTFSVDLLGSQSYKVEPEFLMCHPGMFLYNYGWNDWYAGRFLYVAGKPFWIAYGLWDKYIDNHTQWYDQYAMGRLKQTNEITIYHPQGTSWVTEHQDTYTPITNGVRVRCNSYDETLREYEKSVEALFLIGPAVYYSKIPAYLKGQRSWLSRTPRGCYLEGVLVETPASSSQTAYLYGNAAVQSSLPAYTEGYQANTSSSPAYARGKLTGSGSTPAYLKGSIDTKTSSPAFASGYSQPASSKHAFLWGQVNTTGSAPAYILGGIGVKSAVPAWTRSGWDADTSISAYLNGSTFPFSSMPAYTEGAGIWPFSDDFTGTDEALWNTSKWTTEEV